METSHWGYCVSPVRGQVGKWSARGSAGSCRLVADALGRIIRSGPACPTVVTVGSALRIPQKRQRIRLSFSGAPNAPEGSLRATRRRGGGLARAFLPCALWQRHTSTDPRRLHPGARDRRGRALGCCQSRILPHISKIARNLGAAPRGGQPRRCWLGKTTAGRSRAPLALGGACTVWPGRGQRTVSSATTNILGIGAL